MLLPGVRNAIILACSAHFTRGNAIILACLEYPFLRWVQLQLTICLICPQMFHEILQCKQQKLGLIHCLRKQISMYNQTARREIPPSFAIETASWSYRLYFSSPLLLYQKHAMLRRKGFFIWYSACSARTLEAFAQDGGKNLLRLKGRV